MKYEKRFGIEYARPAGFIAERGMEEFKHRFGGALWAASDHDNACGGPTLLMTLDLNDPRLHFLQAERLYELPLCGYINGTACEREQVYEIIPEQRAVRLVRRAVEHPRCDPDPEDWLPAQLDEIPLKLRSMHTDEYPVDLASYLTARRSFLGSPNSRGGFLRVTGPPLFTIDPIDAVCDCGQEMNYVASIGQEMFHGGNFLNGDVFFIGEGVLYFYLCSDCLRLHVYPESS